jgi:hypothetical protein
VTLRHDLEQRRLHLGRRAIDLVGEHEVVEDRPQRDRERSLVGLVDLRPDDVGRYEVGRELDAGEVAAHGTRQGLDRERLGEAGHALEETVPPREEAHRHSLDHPVLADEHPLDLEQDAFEDGCGVERVEGSAGGLLVHGRS